MERERNCEGKEYSLLGEGNEYKCKEIIPQFIIHKQHHYYHFLTLNRKKIAYFIKLIVFNSTALNVVVTVPKLITTL